MRGLFITGTDTGIGKTVATRLIARQLCRDGHRTGCYKPVCSGSETAADGSRYWSDVELLSEAIGHAYPRDHICPQMFDAPLAPPSAARAEGREVDSALMRQGANWWSDHVDVLLVEGVGGLLCPIATSESVADLAVDLGFPLLIVSPLVLGTINHTLLTIEVAAGRGLEVAGIIFNDIQGAPPDLQESTISEIEARTMVHLLGTMPYNQKDELHPLRATKHSDWLQLAGCPGESGRQDVRP